MAELSESTVARRYDMNHVLSGPPVDRPAGRSQSRMRSRIAPAWKAFMVALFVVPTAVIGTSAASAAKMVKSPAPGQWVKLGTTNAGGAAALWRAPDGRDWVVWDANNHGYRFALLAPDGGIAQAPKSILPGWSAANVPTLLSNGKTPLLVFSGQAASPAKYNKGCIVGAVAGASSFTPQSWSLSSYCDASNTGYGAAAVNAKGVISAAYSAIGGGVHYRIGISPSIPATPADNSFLLGGGAEGFYNEVDNSAGNGHFYLAFDRFFSKPGSADGLWVKDLTANTAPVRAPGTATASTNLLGPVAFANSSRKGGGVFTAYCVNEACGHVFLWRYGTAKAVAVPGSGATRFVAITPGPDGRLWIAWYRTSTNTLCTVRTNKADTRFGPVECYPSPYFEIQTLAIGGGTLGRLDVVLGGPNNAHLAPLVLTTQSLTALALSASGATINNKGSHKISFSVTDAGDPVAGATVIVDGKKLHTNAAGTVTVTFAKGTNPGTYGVSARKANYFPASGKVDVTS